MKDQLQTLRDAVNLLHPDVEQYKKAVDALTQLEAMVGEQEPVAWQGAHDPTDLYYQKPPQADVHPLYRAAPVAQQPQATTESVLIDGIAYDTPAPVAAEMLRLTLELMQAQPQAEAVPCGSRAHCGRFPFCGCGGPDSLPERDTSKPAEQQGLFRKFVVHRTDGSDAPGGKHDGCDYFVLDVTHDAHAKAALAAYAESVEETHPQLAADMRNRYKLAAPQQAEAVPDVRNLISQLENAAHNKGELFERHQGKGWPATASERFTRLRDETIPSLRKQLIAAIAQQKGHQP